MPTCEYENQISTSESQRIEENSFYRCLLLAGGAFGGGGVVAGVPAVAVEFFAAGEVFGLFVPAPEPGEVGFRAVGFGAAVFGPFDVGLPAEDAGAFFLHVLGEEEGADVHPHAVVDIGFPTEGLLVERFPADEKVVGRLAGEDGFELRLQGLGGDQAIFRPRLIALHAILLAKNPVAEVAEGERFEEFAAGAAGGGELVVVNQDVKAVG